MEILNEKIRAQITEEELKEYAAESSRSIVIRYTVNGRSDDRRRDTTLEEAAVIERIIFGAMINISYGRNIKTTADAAEFIGMQFLPGAGRSYNEPHTNSYDTIYLPIKQWARLQEQRFPA